MNTMIPCLLLISILIRTSSSQNNYDLINKLELNSNYLLSNSSSLLKICYSTSKSTNDSFLETLTYKVDYSIRNLSDSMKQYSNLVKFYNFYLIENKGSFKYQNEMKEVLKKSHLDLYNLSINFRYNELSDLRNMTRSNSIIKNEVIKLDNDIKNNEELLNKINDDIND